MKKIRRCLFLIIFLIPFASQAHSPNQSYIYLKVYEEKIEGSYEISTTDLNKLFDWNLPREENKIENLRQYFREIEEYMKAHLAFSSYDGSHPMKVTDFTLLPTSVTGDLIQVHYNLENVTKVPDEITIKYDGVFEKDPTHRGFQIVAYNWKGGVMDNEALVSLTFTPDNIEQKLDLTDSSIMNGFMMMVESGIHHIRIGLDHILFLLALILPSVVKWRRKEEIEPEIAQQTSLKRFFNPEGKWTPVEKFKPAFMYVLVIITFFTIAHSITLSLAALDILNFPARFVESIIAFSIALAAFHNIRPIFKKDWMIALLFGLFHGFGFASVLGEVGLAGEYMTLSLLGFNVGVEIGQILIIACIFPILYLIRRHKIYPYILTYGSILLIMISFYWVIERVFDIDLQILALLKSILGISK